MSSFSTTQTLRTRLRTLRRLGAQVLSTKRNKEQSRFSAEDNKRSRPIMIAFVGVTGSGKTTLIKEITQSSNLHGSKGLESEADTQEITSYPTVIGGRDFLLVDTPGFNDTYNDEAKILRQLARWLSQTYQDGRKLTGLMYIHRINTVRVEGTSMLNLKTFKALCGTECYGNIAFCTTFWDVTAASTGRSREQQLVSSPDLWGKFIDGGAMVRRIEDRSEAVRIVGEFATKCTTTLAIQREMVDRRVEFDETSAGQILNQDLRRAQEELRRKQKTEAEALRRKQKQERDDRRRQEERLKHEAKERRRQLRETKRREKSAVRQAEKRRKATESEARRLRRQQRRAQEQQEWREAEQRREQRRARERREQLERDAQMAQRQLQAQREWNRQRVVYEHNYRPREPDGFAEAALNLLGLILFGPRY